ncbi:MAG: Ni/Fe hydrogenase subunit alpha [Anaerolineae bacterium]|nr:Ni/Fe hydrogenase subunit alpha [Anaerolineae bacterium]
MTATFTKTITIDPVTRIEGHAKITIQLGESGSVEDAHFHVTQFRGFEKLVQGRPFREMPSLMARTCGICPVSHLIAASKACDELLAVRVPPAAVKLRKIMNLAQIVQSHALSFFYLSSPDLLLGMDSDPARRNIFGVLEAEPDMARGGVRLRMFGQNIIEVLSGKRIHPAWIIPGGVADPLTEQKREQIRATIPEAKAFALRTLEWFLPMMASFRDEIDHFANFPTMHMGLISPRGTLEHYDGSLRLIDAEGNVVEPAIEPYGYQDVIGEAVENFSYLKSPYYKPMGYPDGIYRVGPLSRLNIVERAGTPLANEALAAFRKLSMAERQSSFFYHYARLVEIIYGIEQIEQLLDSPDILNTHVQALASLNSFEGVGISEAPRGTLIHHYKTDEAGLVTWANLIIATGNNSLAMDRGVLQAARQFVNGSKLEEGALNRVEAVIRCFDPCLSCSTHAFGQMPLQVSLLDAGGGVLDEIRRG